MIQLNFPVIALSALIPLVIGFIWYNPKVFGTAWMHATGVTPEDGKKMNMAVVFGVTYLLGIFFGTALSFLTIHQFGVMSTLLNEPGFKETGSEMNNYFTDFMTKYGHNFRTFKHGALHGTIGGITLALPMIAINAMFERKGFKYIAINTGYWIVCMALMGGVVCAFT